MRPPFPSLGDYLQLYPATPRIGLDPFNLRDTYYPRSAFTLADTFTNPYTGTVRNGAWSVDAGDLTLPDSAKEPRAYCTQGMASLTFAGTSCILRVQLNSSWGTGKIRIDGKVPSTLGLVAALDVVDCNADSYTGIDGTQYVDVVVADGLAAGNHTLEIVVDNAANKWFCIAAVKSRSFYTLQPYAFSGWHAGIDTRLNDGALTLHNNGGKTIKNVAVTVPAQLKQQNGTAFANPLPVGDLAPGAKYVLHYAIDASAEADSATYTVGLQGYYDDPAGTATFTSDVLLGVANAALTFSSGWTKDTATPGNVMRAFSGGTGKTVTFQTDATSFVVTLQKEYGWGRASVLVGTTSYATLTSADAVGGGFLTDVTVTGLPAGSKTITLKTLDGAAKPFVFTQVKFSKSATFSLVTEQIPLHYTFQHIPPFAPANPRLQAGQIAWDVQSGAQQDLAIPRSNAGLTATQVYTRFPTYAVYYGAGQLDILSQYDLVVIEPKAMTRQQVAQLQAKGVIVLGYISFGEEDGIKTDPFDDQSPQGPWFDDAGGPGGYASYYNKGGNGFGEASECGHDQQRVEGRKACAVGNAKYFTGTGRCSCACTLDSRDGYAKQSTGGVCGGGYTSANNWHRDAMTACANTACPKYAPVNQKCSQYTPGEVRWGQDFSMATPSYPDQNGIWGSSFINPLAPRWQQKISQSLFPMVFDPPAPHTETITLQSHATAGGDTKLVFRVTHWPIDDGEPLTITNVAGTYTYQRNVDYSYDKDVGTFTVDANAGVDAGQTAPVVGTPLVIHYSRKGLQCDGVFMDTVDTVDVYPSNPFQTAFATMINALKAERPTKLFCSNRGFTILDRIIGSCAFVMFESFLVDYNWSTGTYSKITDADSVAFNNGIKQQLKNLRRKHTFDVLALNYCDNGPAGDELRQYIAEQCAQEGYMSWSTTILLNDPLPNNPLQMNPYGMIRGNGWRLLKQV